MGRTRYGTKGELDADREFFRRLEEIRRIAGKMVGLGVVAERVIPKFAIVAEPRGAGSVTARYFVPTDTHASMAVTGAVSINCCCVIEGTVAYDLTSVQTSTDELRTVHNVIIEQPSGDMGTVLKAKKNDDLGSDVQSAGITRTARLLFSGFVSVPSQELEGVTDLDEYREMNQQFRRLYQGVGKPGNSGRNSFRKPQVEGIKVVL